MVKNLTKKTPVDEEEIQWFSEDVNKPTSINIPDLNEIQEDMQDLLKSKSIDKISSELKNIPGMQLVMIDPSDKLLEFSGTSCVQIARSELTTEEVKNWRYAQFVANIARETLKLKSPVSIKVTKNIPSNNYENNAFRKSFAYVGNDLFIRRERFQASSSFIILIAHCISHIVEKDNFSDTNGGFIRNLYLVLRRFNLLAYNKKADDVDTATPGNEIVYDSLLDLKFRMNENKLSDDKSDALGSQTDKLVLKYKSQTQNSQNGRLGAVIQDINTTQNLILNCKDDQEKTKLKIKLQKLHIEKKSLIEK